MENDLKLIYILKVGDNAKGEGIYEFLFSKNPDDIDFEELCWDLSPACDNATPPTENNYDLLINLRTKKFNLICLHDDVVRPYIHGYYTIHALAYEDDTTSDTHGYSSYDSMFNNDDDDSPPLVFHYGMSLTKIKEMLESKKMILVNDSFVEISSIKM